MPATTPEYTDDIADIRGFIERRAQAIRDKSVEGSAERDAPELIWYDATDPLHGHGADTAAQRAREWFDLYDEGPIGYEIRELEIQAAGDVAFCHYLYRVSGRMKRGGEIDMWVRATMCFRKRGGKWLVVHQHDSVPFNPKTQKASLDAKP